MGREGEPPATLVATLLLCVIGPFMVYSATRTAQGSDAFSNVKKQITFILLGVIVMVFAAAFDYRFLKVYAGIVYAVMLGLLVLVQTPLGGVAGGAQRGFYLAGFQFTPSEFMKISLIVMLAAFLSEVRFQVPSLQDVFRATALAALPVLLVFLQPDIGTSIVLCAILGGVLVVSGARLKQLGVLALTALVLIFGAFQLGVVKDYQVRRFTGFLDPENDPLRSDYNRQQAEIAVGAGGVWGLGYLEGTQTNLDYVPEQHTDFIFTVVGEEFGFSGALLVLLLFAVLLWRAFRIALLSKDPFGTYVAAGVASMFAIQMFVNVGMVIGIMPITGIPLPFISYGGTSTLANFAAIGLLLNVHMRRFK